MKEKIFTKEKMFMKKKLLKNSKIHLRKKIVHRGKSFNFFSKYFLKRVKESPRNVNQPQKSIYQEINRPWYTLPSKVSAPFVNLNFEADIILAICTPGFVQEEKDTRLENSFMQDETKKKYRAEGKIFFMSKPVKNCFPIKTFLYNEQNFENI